jgi:hypothetical protein
MPSDECNKKLEANFREVLTRARDQLRVEQADR